MTAIPQTAIRAFRLSAASGAPVLHPVERWLAGLNAMLLAAIAALSALLDQPVGWSGLATAMQFGLVAIAVGTVARARGRLGRLSLGLVPLGLYLLATPLLLVLSYMRFPLGGPTIDAALERVDAWLGYSWPAAVDWAAAHPGFAALMRVIYLSSPFQMLALLVLLAALGRATTLHRFVLAAALSLVACIGIWALAPSFGPSILHAIPADTQEAIGLVTNSRFTAELERLAREGNPVILVTRLGGNVAFPSFHIVMAWLVAWFAWGTWARWPTLAANLLMVPATLVHGGHHLIDLAGGTVVFLAAAALSRRLVPDEGAARAGRPPSAQPMPSDAL